MTQYRPVRVQATSGAACPLPGDQQLLGNQGQRVPAPYRGATEQPADAQNLKCVVGLDANPCGDAQTRQDLRVPNRGAARRRLRGVPRGPMLTAEAADVPQVEASGPGQTSPGQG